MSKNSPRQNYQVFQEWYNWGKTRFNSLKKKKKQRPEFIYFDEDYTQHYND
jgi:hypothetical protein